MNPADRQTKKFNDLNHGFLCFPGDSDQENIYNRRSHKAKEKNFSFDNPLNDDANWKNY